VSSIQDVAWLHNVDERVEEAQQRLSLSLLGLQPRRVVFTGLSD
jgi:hypothetical protein